MSRPNDPQQSFRAALVAHLGHAPDEDIKPGCLIRFSTNGKRSDKSGWCKLFVDGRAGVFGCWRQRISEAWCAIDRATMTRAERAELARQVLIATEERRAKQRQQWAENARRLVEFQAQLVPLVPGDPATLYLKRRGFGGVWPLPACLRLHRGLDYWHEGKKLGTFPAMVAPMVEPDGRTAAWHRTYLAPDGRKADVPTVRKLTAAAGPLAGACIALHKPEGGLIGVAEGIETALGAWCTTGVPVVAAYSAGNLAAWQWPRGVQRIVIFADHDKAGQEAARTLHDRARRAGLAVEVRIPDEAGDDWADVWVARTSAKGVPA
jgi:phage/plasmid primase-like uncharacterized protein